MYKYLLILSAAVLVCCLYSCKKDSRLTKPSIIGKWGKTTTNDTTYSLGTETPLAFGSGTYPDVQYDYYQFNSNGAGFQSEQSSVIETFNYKVANSKIYFSNDLKLEYGNTNLTPHSPSTQQIVLLTDSSMVLRQDTSFYSLNDAVMERDVIYTHYKKIP